MHPVKRFVNEESGAITVDWVVLTAAIVGLGLALVVAIGASISDVSGALEVDLNSAESFSERVTAAFN